MVKRTYLNGNDSEVLEQNLVETILNMKYSGHQNIFINIKINHSP